MRRFHRAWIVAAGALLLIPAAWPQEAEEKPLGDVAREQRDARKLQNPPQKVYRNDDIAPPPEAKDTTGQDTVALAGGSQTDSKTDSKPQDPEDPGKDANTPESSDNPKPANDGEEAKPTPVKPASQSDKATHPVTDRPKDKTPDFYIIPAGTEIKVDISEENQQRDLEHVVEGKVVAPVRIGFATPIPALSKATVQLSMRYYDTGYGETPQSAYAYVAQLTSITVDGVAYDVESSEIAVGPMPGMVSEVSFTLQRALAIKR